MDNVEQFLKSSEAAFNELDTNRFLYEDCFRYLLPYKNTFTQQDKSIERATVQYDSAPMVSANNFVNTLQSSFTPPFTRWAELKAGAGVPEKEKARFNKALAKVTDKVFAYINASNFAQASAEMYFDLGVGHGALWCFEGDEERPLNFVSTPMSHLGLREGVSGEVDARFTKRKVPARLFKEYWKPHEVELNASLEAMMKDKPDQEEEFIEGNFYDYERLSYKHWVVHAKTKHRILEIEFEEQPCFTPRWNKITGHTLAFGPFVMALLDVKTLNKLKQFMLESAALNIFGIYTVANNGALNFSNIKLQPSAFIPVQRNAGPDGPTIAPLPRNGDFQTQEFMIQDLKATIRQIMLDNKLPAETPQPKTAFEIAQRIKEFQVDIGSAYGRLMFEYIQPMFKRVVGILNRKGLLELPEGFNIDNFFVEIQVVSPIAQTQAMEDVQRFMSNIQMTQAAGGPELVMATYKLEDMGQWLEDKVGPVALLRTEEEKQQLAEQAAKVAQQQNVQ